MLHIIGAPYPEILTPEALSFVEKLIAEFTPRVENLLETRADRQLELRQGKKLDFLSETASIRQDTSWKVGSIPKDLQDRRVEITGPVDRKMIINALNSGAKAFMADFEDSLTPGWAQVMEGQVNLRDAVNGTISLKTPEKTYTLKAETAVLIIRPRGWHLVEAHVLYDGQPVYGAFLDFGLYLFHNAKALLQKGSGPYFYLPKLESHHEAKLWDDIFRRAQELLGLPVGTIKATVLIETITAAFEMEEILYALREHIVAQNAGRWDYIFSYIKKHSHNAKFLCPDRAEIVMTKPFLKAYYLLLIQTCHKRGALAMGGMAAQIPIKNDEKANEAALARVRGDKEREAGDGHDGTWVAHPALVPIAREVFDRLMPTSNQISKIPDIKVTASQLLEVPEGNITMAGFRNNISVSLQYLESWLRGVGCVPIFNLMEDAATAEIARTQLWQWIHHRAKFTEDGTPITADLFRKVLTEEREKLPKEGKFEEAARLLTSIVLNMEFEEFLTLRAYNKLNS